MFRPLKRIDNESGVVMFIVLMTAIVIMIFSVGVLTQSMNEMNYAQQQIDQIACDQLQTGLFWNAYNNGAMQNTNAVTVTSGNRTYTLSMVSTANAFTPGGRTWKVSCTYDTF